MRPILICAVVGALVLPARLTAQAGSEPYQRGVAAMQANDGDAAVKAFEAAIAADDRNPEYHLWLARALGVVAQKASVFRQPLLARRCKAEFERTVQLDPNNVAAREGLVQFYMIAPSVMGGSMAKAKEQADAIARLDAVRGSLARGSIASREKDLPAAEREFRAALASGKLGTEGMPSLAGVHYRLGDVLLRKGDKPAAREQFEKALQLNPKLEAARKALKSLS